jgi:hypothetical protein
MTPRRRYRPGHAAIDAVVETLSNFGIDVGLATLSSVRADLDVVRARNAARDQQWMYGPRQLDASRAFEIEVIQRARYG